MSSWKKSNFHGLLTELYSTNRLKIFQQSSNFFALFFKVLVQFVTPGTGVSNFERLQSVVYLMLSTVPGVALFVPQTGLGFELEKKIAELIL